MRERSLTISVAQLQSLALRTRGFNPGLEIRLVQPYEDTNETRVDVYHVRSLVEYDGSWSAWPILPDGETGDEQLASGTTPDPFEGGRLW